MPISRDNLLGQDYGDQLWSDRLTKSLAINRKMSWIL